MDYHLIIGIGIFHFKKAFFENVKLKFEKLVSALSLVTTRVNWRNPVHPSCLMRSKTAQMGN